MFESFVNSERCKTGVADGLYNTCLRALLIQKDVKRQVDYSRDSSSLRALLIQKDVKRFV